MLDASYKVDTISFDRFSRLFSKRPIETSDRRPKCWTRPTRWTPPTLIDFPAFRPSRWTQLNSSASFKMDATNLTWRNKRLVLDVVMSQQKTFSARNRRITNGWKKFRMHRRGRIEFRVDSGGRACTKKKKENRKRKRAEIEFRDDRWTGVATPVPDVSIVDVVRERESVDVGNR